MKGWEDACRVGGRAGVVTDRIGDGERGDSLFGGTKTGPLGMPIGVVDGRGDVLGMGT